MMAENRPVTHDDLVKLLFDLGYHKSVSEGVCHGASMMFIQAALSNDIEAFNKRLQYIVDHDVPLEVAAFKEKMAQANQHAASLDPIKNTVNFLDEILRKLNVTSPEDEELINLLAFLDGVELYQSPEEHPEYFEMPCSYTDPSRRATAKIASPLILDQKNGLAEQYLIDGIYNDQALQAMFSEWDKIAKEVNHSFALSLSSPNHTIALHYDATISRWWVFNANDMPAKTLSVDELAQWVKRSFFNETPIGCSTRLYLPANERETVGNTLSNCIASSSVFQTLQAVTPLKAETVLCDKVSWLDLAARDNDYHNLKALIAMQADVNNANRWNAMAADAARAGQTALIQVLGENQVNLNAPCGQFKYTPAHIATESSHAAVLEALHKAGADLNQQNRDGKTPAGCAAWRNQLDMLKLLARLGVDLTQGAPHRTPLELAREAKATQCIEFLERYSGDEIAATKDIFNGEVKWREWSAWSVWNNISHPEPESMSDVKRFAKIN